MEVVDVFGVNDNADFTARLDSVSFFDAFEGGSGVFKFGKALDVRVERFFAGAGAGRGNGIGGLDNDVFDGFGGGIFVVSGDSVNDAFVNFKFAENVSSDGGMRAFDFVIYGFADIVEEAGFTGNGNITAEFGGEHGGKL